METIDSILQQLDEGGDLDAIRCAIADLITHHLEWCRERNNLAALAHFTNAVGSLALNVNASRQPITVGLHTSLMDLEKAIATIERNEQDYDLRVKRAEQITYDLLIEAVQAIRDKASCQTQDDNIAAFKH